MPRARERFAVRATHPTVGDTMNPPRKPMAPTNVNADTADIDFVLFALEYRIGTRAEMPNPATAYPAVAVRTRRSPEMPMNGDEIAAVRPAAAISE